ncbi:MAG: YdcF family protein [Proteobacteria bacterium]|nr:YdcF family protein [Pseudomonadota bacterium]
MSDPVIAALLMVVAGAIARASQRRVLSRNLLAGAALVGYLGTIPFVGDALLGPLERQYPPLGSEMPRVSYVVVLGSGYTPHDGVPITAALDSDGLARVVEGVRLERLLGSAKLVLSGGEVPGHSAPAVGYAVLSRDLGVPDTAIVVLPHSANTAAESRAVARLIGQAPFILVTSAYHMPRAMRLMQRAGAHPIPAPTGQRVGGSRPPLFGLLPGAGGLESTKRALHEYLGMGALAVGFN